MSAKVLFALVALFAMISAVSASMTLARVVTFENGTDTVVYERDYFNPIYTYNDTTMQVSIVVAPRTSKLALGYMNADLVEYIGDYPVFEVVGKLGKGTIVAMDGRDESVVFVMGLNKENVLDVLSRLTLL